MSIIKVIDELDNKVSKWQGVKFNGNLLDSLWYTAPRFMVLGAILLLIIYLRVS